jgi:hypothetical protein
VAHVKDTRPHLRKLNDRIKPTIFVGYEAESMAYQAYDPATRRLHITRDVVFDEDAKWCWENDKINSEFIMEYVQAGQPEVVITRHEMQATSPVPKAGAAASPVPGGGAASPAAAQVTPGPVVVHASPPAHAGMQLDVNHDNEAPLRFRTPRSIDDAGPAFGLAQPEPMADLLMVDTEEPASFQEAHAHECWRQAMLDEMTVIEANGTWKLEDAPVGIRPIGLKWVFKMKRDTTGNISKYKARLVVKGYVQQ